MSKPLYLAPSKRVPGLYIYCSKCDCVLSDKCKLSDLPIEKCKHGDKHRYKGIIYLEGTARKTKTFGRNYAEAVEGVARLRNDTKRKRDGEEAPAITLAQEEPEATSKRPDTRNYALLPLMARYVDFLHNDPQLVPEFRKKVRSKGHLDDVERVFSRFAIAAKKSNRKLETLRIDAIDDGCIGEFLKHIIDDLEVGNAGYNRALTLMTSFYEYLIERENYPIKNPFVGITRKPIKENVETIEEEEFLQLLEIIQKPELGICILSNGVKKNYFKPWMHDAIKLLLYGGRRRTETVLMKWSDIVYKNDEAQHIKVPDYKVNRAKNLAVEDWLYRYVPITAELVDLLRSLGEEKYRGSEKYIIAPDEAMSRDSMARLISKSFAHYAKQIGLSLSLGALRRTNFSSLSAAIGMENAQAVSGHAQIKTLKRHYVSKRVLAKTAQEFNVYDKSKQHEGIKKEDRSIER